MSVHLYVEGGGDSKELRTRCREGFAKLIERAGFQGRMPRIVASGSRDSAFDDFKTALRDASSTALLLVDSEEPVTAVDPWTHLKQRDNWDRPPRARDDQAQLMVTCMETWIVAGRSTLRAHYGAALQESALFPVTGLDSRNRHDMFDSLEHATRRAGKGRAYAKGKLSFVLLARLDHTELSALPHFQRFVDALNRYNS